MKTKKVYIVKYFAKDFPIDFTNYGFVQGVFTTRPKAEKFIRKLAREMDGSVEDCDIDVWKLI